MTDSEYRINKVEDKVNDIYNRQESFETFIKERIKRQDELIEELKRESKEYREQSEKRFEQSDKRFEQSDKRFERIEDKLDSMNKHVRNLSVAAMVGIGTMCVTMIIFCASVIIKN